MSFEVKYHELTDIQSLEMIWASLEVGDDMTYFQSYHWNVLLGEYVPVMKGIECGYYVVYKDGSPVMIAPLWIVTKRINLINEPGVYFIGRKSFSDYLNLIYRDFDSKAFAALVKYISDRFGSLKWTFEELKEGSELGKFLSSLETKKFGRTIEDLSKTACPLLTISELTEAYTKSLSKSTRQNIRTGWNRAKKDKIEFVINFDDKNVDKQECIRIREDRTVRQWHAAPTKISFRRKIKFLVFHRMLGRTAIQFPSFLPFVKDERSKMMTIRDAGTGDIAAFFNYGLDDLHHEAVIMAAGVNKAYSRYSPGMLLMKSYIDDITDNQSLQRIDFTRGEEPYKFSLGAKSEYNRSFVYRFNIKRMVKEYL